MSLVQNYVYSIYDTINIRNGKTGIGTTTPTELFSVVGGSVYVERMTNVASNIDFAYSTLSNVAVLRSDKITSQSSSTIDLSYNTVSNVNTISLERITSDGDTITFNNKNLSNINNATVTSNLYVNNVLYASNLQVLGEFTTLNTLTSNTEQMTVTNAGSGPALLVRQTGNESVASFYDDNALAMYIGGSSSDAGFVGIGTSAADSRLHVYDTKAILTHIQTTTSNQAQIKMTNTGGDTLLGPSTSQTIDFLSTANQPMRIGTNSAEYVRIATNGNVGIGSSSPIYPLDITGKTRIQDALYLRTNGMNTIFYSFGGQSFTSGNNKYIGLTLAWANTATENKYAFRVKVKCHLAAETSVAYRKFETMITPKNDSGNSRPNQIISTEIADTNNDDFSQLTHTVTRAGNSSVDLKVAWSTTVTAYLGNIQIEVFSHNSLGDFTFTPIYG
jgi:hypothetical protein